MCVDCLLWSWMISLIRLPIMRRLNSYYSDDMMVLRSENTDRTHTSFEDAGLEHQAGRKT